ncbi:MAG: isopentenyl-diphosphate Delta-isomerase [Candidatus Izemoplasmatales bacterium]
MPDDILLVDEDNNPIGTGEKMDVHRRGVLHRCFSVLIYNSKKEMLLQKRAANKYHCPGQWSNACCSHPAPGEHLLMAAKKRLKEEMGISTPVKETGVEFIYKVRIGDLTEYEYDHLLYGQFDGKPLINREEADDWRWMAFSDIRDDMKANPDIYTPWFRLIISQGDNQVDQIPVARLEKYEIKKLATYG